MGRAGPKSRACLAARVVAADAFGPGLMAGGSAARWAIRPSIPLGPAL